MDRFWNKVDKRHWKQCWEWSAARDSWGYGSFWYNGSSVMASRFSLILSTGQNPLDKVACHKCDNPPCVNPHHLFWGTQKENMSDMLNKGRASWQKQFNYNGQNWLETGKVGGWDEG